MIVAAVILAAGAGTRFGLPKATVMLDSRSLVDRVASLAREAGCDPILAVVPAGVFVAGAEVVENPEPARGLSRSLALGLAAVPHVCEAALILLGDQPTMPIGNLRAVLDHRGTRPVRAASADGVLAPPVLLARSHFFLAGHVRGDAGLRGVLASQPDLVEAVPVAAHPPDIDTPADLEALARRLESGA